MKNLYSLLLIIMLCAVISQCTKTNSSYELAAQYDNSTVQKAQKSMAHIESENIDIRALKLAMSEFGSSYADMNASENWIQPTYTFVSENMFPSLNTPKSINGIILAKFKSKDKIDTDFGLNNDEPQGICADVQEDIYSNTLSILTEEERERYEKLGKKLYFISDDDMPPLNDTTNPVVRGSAWLDVDPASKITREGDAYYYEPMSLFVEFDDPAYKDMSERYRGVRYCKFLSHQAILSWMLQKSFEANPVLIAESKVECTEPSSRETTTGSCIFYFPQALTYYCEDYTGSGFTPEAAEAKCNSRPDNPYLTPSYSPSSCSERTEEIKTSIPGYIGLTGLCVIHCQTPEEFIWNIYTENPETSCTGFTLFYPGETAEMNK